MPVCAHDDMVQNLKLEQLPGMDQVPSHLDVCFRLGGSSGSIATGFTLYRSLESNNCSASALSLM